MFQQQWRVEPGSISRLWMNPFDSIRCDNRFKQIVAWFLCAFDFILKSLFKMVSWWKRVKKKIHQRLFIWHCFRFHLISVHPDIFNQNIASPQIKPHVIFIRNLIALFNECIVICKRTHTHIHSQWITVSFVTINKFH